MWEKGIWSGYLSTIRGGVSSSKKDELSSSSILFLLLSFSGVEESGGAERSSQEEKIRTSWIEYLFLSVSKVTLQARAGGLKFEMNCFYKQMDYGL